MLIALLINKKLATFETDATQDLHQQLEELGVVHGARKNEMSKMTWAVVIVLST